MLLICDLQKDRGEKKLPQKQLQLPQFVKWAVLVMERKRNTQPELTSDFNQLEDKEIPSEICKNCGTQKQKPEQAVQACSGFSPGERSSCLQEQGLALQIMFRAVMMNQRNMSASF